jgi:hypothetical protein
MLNTMKTEITPDTLVPVPSGLIPEIQAAAEEERRALRELVQEALERYMADREWKKILAYGQERAKALGLTEQDVPRLIAEYRREKRQGRE